MEKKKRRYELKPDDLYHYRSNTLGTWKFHKPLVTSGSADSPTTFAVSEAIGPWKVPVPKDTSNSTDSPSTFAVSEVIGTWKFPAVKLTASLTDSPTTFAVSEAVGTLKALKPKVTSSSTDSPTMFAVSEAFGSKPAEKNPPNAAQSFQGFTFSFPPSVTNSDSTEKSPFAVLPTSFGLPNSFDSSWLDSIEVDEAGVNRRVKKLEYLLQNKFEKNHELAWLLRAVTCIDLTTLSGDDTCSNVRRLCYKAVHPISTNLIKLFKEDIKFDDIDKLKTAAVCVYPSKVSTAANEIKKLGVAKEVGVASVATGFPSGQYPLETKLKEIEYCIKNGATEIDIVISRELVICGKWKELYDEIKAMKKKCEDQCGRNVHLKTILATGECGSLKNVYKASLVAMLAGSDFIKTSTGKETVNATLQVGVVMCRAIDYFYEHTGKRVGLKPAGGIRTSHDALGWLVLIKELLGRDWLDSKLFRIGASGLLGDIEKRLFYLIKGFQPPPDSFFLG